MTRFKFHLMTAIGVDRARNVATTLANRRGEKKKAQINKKLRSAANKNDRKMAFVFLCIPRHEAASEKEIQTIRAEKWPTVFIGSVTFSSPGKVTKQKNEEFALFSLPKYTRAPQLDIEGGNIDNDRIT